MSANPASFRLIDPHGDARARLLERARPQNYVTVPFPVSASDAAVSQGDWGTVFQNRADDLIITSRGEAVHRGPRGHSPAWRWANHAVSSDRIRIAVDKLLAAPEETPLSVGVQRSPSLGRRPGEHPTWGETEGTLTLRCELTAWRSPGPV